MKKIAFSFALVASLIIASIVCFVNIQDSIISYVGNQNEKFLFNSFIGGVNNNKYLPSYKRSQPDESTKFSDLKEDDPLHQILREIALCR